jgi:hypothetical protein
MMSWETLPKPPAGRTLRAVSTNDRSVSLAVRCMVLVSRVRVSSNGRTR